MLVIVQTSCWSHHQRGSQPDSPIQPLFGLLLAIFGIKQQDEYTEYIAGMAMNLVAHLVLYLPLMLRMLISALSAICIPDRISGTSFKLNIVLLWRNSVTGNRTPGR